MRQRWDAAGVMWREECIRSRGGLCARPRMNEGLRIVDGRRAALGRAYAVAWLRSAAMEMYGIATPRFARLAMTP